MMIPRQVTYDGVKIVLNPRDPVVSGALFLRVYEREELRLVRSLLRPGMVALDVGANLGFYTALLGQATGPQGRVIALEPDPENFSFLQRTVAANQFKNVELIQAAAGREPGHLTLYSSSDNRGDNRMYANELADRSEEVEVVRLDDLLEQRGVMELDFLKIDVQGYEGQVLAGLERTLRRSRRLVALVEFWPHGLRSAGTDPEAYLEQLLSWGFRIEELVEGQGPRVVEDVKALVNAYPGRRYGNIVLRGADLTALMSALLDANEGSALKERQHQVLD